MLPDILETSHGLHDILGLTITGDSSNFVLEHWVLRRVKALDGVMKRAEKNDKLHAVVAEAKLFIKHATSSYLRERVSLITSGHLLSVRSETHFCASKNLPNSSLILYQIPNVNTHSMFSLRQWISFRLCTSISMDAWTEVVPNPIPRVA